MGKTISVSFEITDHGTFRKVMTDAEELGRAVRDVQDEAQIAVSFAQALRSCTDWVQWLAFGITVTARMN